MVIFNLTSGNMERVIHIKISFLFNAREKAYFDKHSIYFDLQILCGIFLKSFAKIDKQIIFCYFLFKLFQLLSTCIGPEPTFIHLLLDTQAQLYL